MSDHNDFRSWAAKEKTGSDVEIRFTKPVLNPPDQPGGQPQMSVGDSGTLMAVFNDGVLIRASRSERFYIWDMIGFMDFPSKVVLD